VSLFLLAAIFSLASYFTSKLELQSKLELVLTNSSQNLDFEKFYQSGNPNDVTFDANLMLAKIKRDFRQIRKYRNLEVLKWNVKDQTLWIEVTCPWKSPIGSFEILPDSITAMVHLKMDSNRHLQ